MRDERPNTAEVRRLAHLARIEVSEGELTGLCEDLEAILEWIAQLSAPPSQALDRPPLEVGPRLAEDEPRCGLAREAALDAAPEHDGRLFLVPWVLSR